MDQTIGTWEVHTRPMLLQMLHGVPSEKNKWEVDLWYFAMPGIGRILREYVCDNIEKRDVLIALLQKDFDGAIVVREKE